MKQEITIIDIARKAGVSTATVSRVLNGTGKVRENTRRKVEAAVRELDYQPNIVAKNLSTARSNVIGVLVSDVRNPFYANIFVECEMYANEKGFSLLLYNFLDSESLERRCYDMLLAQRVCAIVHIGGSVDRMDNNAEFVKKIEEVSRRVPVVTSAQVNGTQSRCVQVNNERCMRKLMEYLLGLGHKRIALAGGRENVRSTWEKRKCYQEMLKRQGIEYGNYYIAESGAYNEQGGYLAMREILKKDPLPTAVIAVSDLVAVGVVHAIKEKGLEIGKDISVASFDNTYIAEIMEPELTSVGNDYCLLGRRIIDMVLGMMDGKECQDWDELPVLIEERESCK
ncbi:LacI family DNA-binding transcriptional regulator [Parablautia muri]|uniref:LacI family transcriptional regulator n=1 Tax=Parablautia muri TaxID=2320879 RepID=A0A9X5BES8_9FIRM|nr:LacI family DNA-binding transcriptional regulator [Parablautia muri]NBJ92399.1 LacI family transcriptional regulator [Parablautia muri]